VERAPKTAKSQEVFWKCFEKHPLAFAGRNWSMRILLLRDILALPEIADLPKTRKDFAP